MSRRNRIFLGILLLFSFGVAFLLYRVSTDLDARYRESAEESLVDTAHLLASLVETDMREGRIDPAHLRAAPGPPVAPQLTPVRINAICPGIADTPMLDQHDQRAIFAADGFPLLQPEEVAAAMWLAATSEGTGECWFVQPGRDPAPFRFPNVPGPRREGGTVGLPPLAS